jgi:hypothetical protein
MSLVCEGKIAENIAPRSYVHSVERRKNDYSIFTTTVLNHKSLLHGDLGSRVELNGPNDYSALRGVAGHLNGPNDSSATGAVAASVEPNSGWSCGLAVRAAVWGNISTSWTTAYGWSNATSHDRDLIKQCLCTHKAQGACDVRAAAPSLRIKVIRQETRHDRKAKSALFWMLAFGDTWSLRKWWNNC